MKEKVLFFASQDENLDVVPATAKFYERLIKCILEKSKELCNKHNIRLTTGTLTSAETGDVSNIIIERYPNQLNNLNCSLTIYVTPINNKTTILRKMTVNNLYEYLQATKIIEMIPINNFHDHAFFNIPYDNADLIEEVFTCIINEDNIKEKKLLLCNLKSKFKNQKQIINQIAKIISRMSKEEALDFINHIFNKRRLSLDYDLITKSKKVHPAKTKIKIR